MTNKLTLVHRASPSPHVRFVLGEATLHEANVVVVERMVPIIPTYGAAQGLHELPRQSLASAGEAHNKGREDVARDGFTGFPFARGPVPRAEGAAGFVAIATPLAKFRTDLVERRSKTEGRQHLAEDPGLLER